MSLIKQTALMKSYECFACKEKTYTLHSEILCKNCHLKVLKGELGTMNKQDEASKIMQNLLNNIIDSQDKQARIILDLLERLDKLESS